MSFFFARGRDACGIIDPSNDGAEFLGRCGDHFPNAERYGTNVRLFFSEVVAHQDAPYHAWGDLYHAWVVHSEVCPAVDGIHCPIDFYWQGPGMSGGDYQWHVLLDCLHPEGWPAARRVLLNGRRDWGVDLLDI